MTDEHDGVTPFFEARITSLKIRYAYQLELMNRTVSLHQAAPPHA